MPFSQISPTIKCIGFVTVIKKTISLFLTTRIYLLWSLFRYTTKACGIWKSYMGFMSLMVEFNKKKKETCIYMKST